MTMRPHIDRLTCDQLEHRDIVRDGRTDDVNHRGSLPEEVAS